MALIARIEILSIDPAPELTYSIRDSLARGLAQ